MRRALILGCLIGIMALSPLVSLALEEDLVEADLEIDLEAEALPNDGISYHTENFFFSMRRLFTFNSEKKIELDKTRLHALDRKAAACAEIGDQACVDKIDARAEKLEAITHRFLEKREELRVKHLVKFEEWRARRQEKIEQFKEKAEGRSDRAVEFRQEFMDKRKEVKDRIKQREQNRDHLIEVRDKNLKQRLDNVQDRAAERQAEVDRELQE